MKKTGFDHNGFAAKVASELSLSALASLVFIPRALGKHAYIELKKRLSGSNFSQQEISTIIKLLVLLDTTVRRKNVEIFYGMLYAVEYAFSICDLKCFLIAFGGKGNVGITALNLFFKHEDFKEADLLEVFEGLARWQRKAFYDQCLEVSPKNGEILSNIIEKKK